MTASPQRMPGRPRVTPERRLQDGVVDGTVYRQREKNRVIAVTPRQVFASPEGLEDGLGRSAVSNRENTSFVERQTGPTAVAVPGKYRLQVNHVCIRNSIITIFGIGRTDTSYACTEYNSIAST